MSSLDAIYSKLAISPPTLSPEARYQRRLAWRNERVFYKRKCDYSGRSILSIFSEDKPFPVYAQDIWASDCWNALDYGRDYDFSRPFFEQFRELLNVVPQRAMNAYSSENCEYTNQCANNKNCYLLVACSDCENCYYSMWAERSQDCMDCLYVEQCELCYELFSGKRCYECTFSEALDACTACHFCRDCIGCSNCFGSVNLRNKEYYFLNQPCSKEEYLEKLHQLNLQTRAGIENAFNLIKSHFSLAPRKYFVGRSIENSTGDFIQETKDSKDIFNCRHVENLFFSQDAWRANFSTDLTETIDNSFCIELEGSVLTNECGFSMKLSQVNSGWYSSHCSSGHDIFGCVGLRNMNYCILNREYSPGEFFDLRAKIIAQMKANGEWGEHFPIELSPFGYNETVAMEYFPLQEEDVIEKGWHWKSELTPASSSNLSPPESPEAKGLLEDVFCCKVSKRPFRIIAAEQDFYLKMHLPVPDLAQDERHRRRMAKRNPRKLNQGECLGCKAKFLTTYPAGSATKVLCEDCYAKAVD